MVCVYVCVPASVRGSVHAQAYVCPILWDRSCFARGRNCCFSKTAVCDYDAESIGLFVCEHVCVDVWLCVNECEKGSKIGMGIKGRGRDGLNMNGAFGGQGDVNI